MSVSRESMRSSRGEKRRMIFSVDARIFALRLPAEV
jgi:hypothetical protein